LALSNSVEQIVFISGTWPRITPRTVLQRLSLKFCTRLDTLPKWRDEFTGYAQVFTDYQRSQCLVSLAQLENKEEFYKELDLTSDNSGADTHDPDWLLVQVSYERLRLHRLSAHYHCFSQD
jgi:hypothetical protein